MKLSAIQVNLSAFDQPKEKLRSSQPDTHSIAIIGIGLRLPQANSPEQFARLLQEGRDAVRPIPAMRRRDVDRYLGSLGKAPSEIQYGEAAYLDAIDRFDYSFFKLSPKEASLMDPNQRLFLQTAWHALEDAGYAGEMLRGSRTGVYLGYGSDGDYRRMISEVDPASAPLSMPGNVRPIIASRLSYLLDLKGPSLAVDTTCSSSLVAVHLACQALRSGECDTALVGGIQLHLVPVREFEVGVESSTSRTRTFDYAADGTGTGEGAVAILLKPLSKALEDRDAVYAVIKGSAINQDGSSAGITAPNAAAQAAVLEEAWRRSGIEPDTLRYIEAHGTGTKLGDPIELEGIEQAFRRFTSKPQFCAIGSVKSNLGHLDNAAGIAGLVKAALSLQQKVLFPTLHFTRPNPNIDFIHSPVYVNQRLLQWEADEHPRRCGVSSFGISGTNCHVVLEEAPCLDQQAVREYTPPRPELFVLSGLTPDSLRKLAARMLSWLRRQSSISLADLCFTLGVGRGHEVNRMAIIASDREQLVSQLEAYARGYSDAAPLRNKVQPAITVSSEKQLPEDVNRAAAQLVEEYVNSEKCDDGYLHELAQLYLAGASLRWEKLYQREKRYRLHLPVYPFDEKRCWLHLPEEASEARPALFHRPEWREATLPDRSEQWREERCLLIQGENASGKELALKLRQHGHTVYECVWKEVLAGGEQSLSRLWRTIREQRMERIVHLGSWDGQQAVQEANSWETQLQQGLYGLQAWLRAMSEEKGSHVDGQQLELCLVTNFAQAVSERQERINPPHAAMLGFAKAIRWEHPSFRVRTIDTDHATGAEQLMQELFCGSNAYHVAYRHGQRFESYVDSVALEPSDNGTFTWRTDGIYLITGGLGGIGLALAKHMADQAPVKLALLSRSGRQARKLAQIEELEELGAQVICCEADVADEEQMRNVIAMLRAEHGPICGVIHAAGISAGNYLTKLEEAELRAVMRAKERGTLNLVRVLQEDEPDFIALCSSAITLVGGVGSGPYTAANAFLDAYAAHRSAMGHRTLAINWPAWDQTGLSEGADIEEEKELFRLLPPREAAECFELALRSGQSQLYVGEWNRDCALFRLGDMLPFQLSADLERWLQPVHRDARPSAADRSAAVHAGAEEHVQLKGGADEYSEIEMRVAQAWYQVLGYDELDIHANFFEIGGDSILITNVHARLEEIYPGVLKVADLFTYPTIAKLSAYVREQLLKEEAEPLQALSGYGESHAARKQQLRSLLQQLAQQQLTVEQAVARYREMEVGG